MILTKKQQIIWLKKINLFYLKFYKKTRYLNKNLKIFKYKPFNFLNFFWHQKFKKIQLRTIHAQKEQNKKYYLLKKYNFGLISTSFGWLTHKQFESIRKILTKQLKKKTNIWKRNNFFFRCLPNKSLTKKPQNIRMGKGKGNFQAFIYQIKKGRIFFEITTNSNLHRNLLKISKKLPPFIKVIQNSNKNILN